VPEARLEDSGSGLAPAEEGWFVVNARDAEWWTSKSFGSGCVFESEAAEFQQLGINISVLEPGKPNCLYHSEAVQEDFLVLSGECKLLVDGEERPLKPWDFVHVPAGTEHVFVGAGEEPCVVLMTGARVQPEQLFYPKSELAAQYDASAEETTPDPKQAYARFERSERGRPEYWDRLPWAQLPTKF
jgi:uncharacterized cupin superfamily protein